MHPYVGDNYYSSCVSMFHTTQPHITCQVMRRHNPHFKSLSKEAIDEQIVKCVPTESPGAVTILLSKPDQTHDFGHLAMVVHDDHNLRLPDDHNTTHYVSFSPEKASMGPMLTGTKSHHGGFGTNVKGVTHVLTLYNIDTDAVLKKWDSLKKSGRMYDLMDSNCARAVIDVFHAGYPNCVEPHSLLWTPESAFGYLKKVCKHWL